MPIVSIIIDKYCHKYDPQENVDDVQQYLNDFENKLILIVDDVATLEDYHGNVIKEKAQKVIKK